MFTVKATYRNETRKFSFSGTSLFPTYEELYQQLYRIFPISHNYYLSKLIFSPDASKPSRILIGKEVHNAEEYNTRIAPLRRHWPNPLLRFSIFDETPHKVPSATVEDSRAVPSPLSFMAIPPPPVLLSTPAPHELSSTSSPDSPFQRFLAFKAAHLPPPSSRPLPTPQRPSFLASPILPSFVPPPPPIIFPEPPTLSRHPSLPSLTPQAVPSQPCCSVAKGKLEIEALLASFRKDIDRIMLDTFGECNASAQVDTSHRQTPHASSEALGSTMDSSTVSPSTCFVCRNEFSGSWYGCVKCSWHYICPSCFSKSGSIHTLSFGPTHVVQQREATPSIAITPSATEIPAESQSSGNKLIDAEPNQRPPVIHRNIVCDKCNKTIVGIRHKCLDCPDYDLCTSCIETGAAEMHNSFHEFFDIETPGRVFVHTVFSGSGERDASPIGRNAAVDSPRAATPASTVRHCAACNMCDSPIVGDRFKCVNCPGKNALLDDLKSANGCLKDFDTCANCFKITGEQHPYHGFVRVSKTSDLMMRNAVTNTATHYATCDSCQKTIRGVRYKCMHPSCPDFDLCQNCEALPIPVHPSIHPLLKMKTPDTVIPTVYRVGMTNLIHTRRTSQGSTPPQALEPYPSQSPPVPESRTSPEISVKNEQEPPVVVPESLSPLAILAQCPDCVSANSVGPWGYGLTPAKLPQSLQSHAPNFEEPPPSTTSSISSCDQAVKPVESQQPSAVDREQSTSPYSDLVQTINRPSAEVHSPPLDLGPSLDIFREVWPKVNREMKHLSEARRSEVDLPSSVADSDRAIETDLGKLVESTNSLVGMPPIESVQSLLETLSRCIPPFPDFEVPPMIEPLVFADSDLAAPLRGFRTLSPAASEAPAASSATSSALPDSVMDEQAAATPSPEQQQARTTSFSCAFVSDTTVPDGQIFPPGAEFVKSWRMSNDGEEPWPETTEVHFVAGESFSPEADSSMVVKVGRVDPGEALDVWTGDLKAPDAPGRYVGYWKMTDGAGQSFGANIWIDVTVTEPRQSADEADDHSLASSSMVMPKSSSDNRSAHSVGPLGHLFEPSYPSTSKPTTDVTDDGASDGSSVSLVSVPSSDDYGSDWQDTRSQPENLEYVVLYDSNGSEDE